MQFLRRATPAFWVAIAALVISMTGASFAAAGLVTSKNIKDKTIKVKDLNPKTVTALKGATGPAGPAGAAGSAKAYGVIDNSGPTILAGHSKGIASVTRPVTGDYCITLTDPAATAANTTAITTPEWGNSSGFSLNAYSYVEPSGAPCPAGTDIEVKTYTFTSTTESAASNNVAFFLLVP